MYKRQAIIGSRKLGAIELKPKRKFYDYQAKYDAKAKTKHIIPVDLKKNEGVDKAVANGDTIHYFGVANYKQYE